MKSKLSSTFGLALLSGAVITAGIGYVVYSSVSEGTALEYFKNVDEVLGQPGRWRGKRLRLHGNVVAGTIQKKKGALDYRFAIFSNDQWVEVTYRGLMPDTFKDCAEVVVKGKLVGPRAFRARDVTAKCPSKYDEQQRLKGCGEAVKPKVIRSRLSAR